MTFVQIDIDKEIEKRKRENSSFEKKWNESREEYKNIGKKIQLKKQTIIDEK